MVSLEPTPLSFKMQAYLALKGSIMEMDIYGQPGDSSTTAKSASCSASAGPRSGRP